MAPTDMRSRLLTLLLSLTMLATLAGPALSAPRRAPLPAPPTPVVARASGAPLHLPSADVVQAGFHQANSWHAVTMKPQRGRTMASRHRGTSRTTAVDVQVRRNTTVVAPMTGRVASVTPYRLYGRYRDVKIEIIPQGRPRSRAVVLHVAYPKVEAGDRVLGGRTAIAGRSRMFPFGSQIDGYTGQRLPHVHVEVRRF